MHVKVETMKDTKAEQARDDSHIEITDLDAPAIGSDASRRARRLLSLARQRKRVVTLLTGSIIVLAILLILGSNAAVQGLVGDLYVRIVPTPLPTLPPGADLFYVQADPPWGHLFIDGQRVARLPVIEKDAPLRLPRGQHTLLWQAAPFQPQQCIFMIPIAYTYANNDCTIVNQRVPLSGNVSAYLVSFRQSLNTLPGAARTSLIAAVQQALNAAASSDIVRPGERYVLASGDPQCRSEFPEPLCYATARQPLSATLGFQLDTGLVNTSRTCMNDPESGCTYMYQSCYTFCTTSGSGQDAWDVFAPVLPRWTFATMDGRVLEQDVSDNSLYTVATGDTVVDALAELHIAWNNQSWQVTMVAESSNGFVHPACGAAQFEGFPLNPPVDASGQPVYLQWQFTTGSKLAAGCLGIGTPQPNPGLTPTPLAGPPIKLYTLHRFGVLLAANDQAQRAWPNLPAADAYEQQIAQQIASA